ncbi:Integrator complex subunit 2 [Dinochytrium kinnereticum]|nr:Integrator complex subunit 2 [Dinochytrium kinnereticum]
MFALRKASNSLQSFKESHLQALLDLQETAVIQTLLELCLKLKSSRKSDNNVEVSRKACLFIHQRFINTIKYIKLVHFQGYDMDLIPITVAEIPSMHVCFEFIPELLAQPQTEKQVFGAILSAHLFEKYPLPASSGERCGIAENKRHAEKWHRS